MLVILLSASVVKNRVCSSLQSHQLIYRASCSTSSAKCSAVQRTCELQPKPCCILTSLSIHTSDLCLNAYRVLLALCSCTLLLPVEFSVNGENSLSYLIWPLFFYFSHFLMVAIDFNVHGVEKGLEFEARRAISIH